MLADAGTTIKEVIAMIKMNNNIFTNLIIPMIASKNCR